ncbi:hypothetical protein [Actinorhabdospora filicis]|uniref:hypothetical protein n=1 Tax=Actinorhabdospora filicis TaxID=1785913 RepID=UPI002552E267|nr:hypothetical protein [Actinorhabdospora filicis]
MTIDARPASWQPRHRRPQALVSGPVAALAVVLAWLAILGSGVAAGIDARSVTVGLMTGAAVLFALLGCSVVVLGFAALIRGGRD